MRTRIRLLFVLTVLLAAPCAWADDQSQDAGPPTRTPQSPDFMLHQPRGWMSLSGGLVFPRASGDLFTFLGDQLTLDRRDFRSNAVAFEVGVSLTSRLDVVGGLEGGRRTANSEYRDFVTSARDPITQQTKLSNSNVTVGVRYTPLGTGRRLSRFAFVPRRFSPFIGGGLNVGFYRLSQYGQFVDFTDRSIFYSSLFSSGHGLGSYLNGGVDLQVWRALYLKVQGKYTWTQSPMSNDFVGFDGIDLSGFRSSTGLSVIF